MKRRRLISIGSITFMLTAGQVHTTLAEVGLHALFSDHAVLQRGMPVPVWGTASPGEQVTVNFNGQTKSVAADDSGNWMIHLDPMDASNAAHDMVITGENMISRTGIQIGEVWVGSGQSNMQRPVGDDLDAAEAIADAPNHNMRFFNVTANGGNVSNTVWQVSDETSAPAMSAVHFYFGRHLAQMTSTMTATLWPIARTATVPLNRCANAWLSGPPAPTIANAVPTNVV